MDGIDTQKRRNQSGATLVEFACAMMPTFACIFLYVNLCWIIFQWVCLQEAVREGVRSTVACPSVTSLTTNAQSVIETFSFGFITASNVASTVTVQFLDGTTLSAVSGKVTTGDLVKISIGSFKVNIFAPVWEKVSPIYLGAVSADVMACRTPQSQ